MIERPIPVRAPLAIAGALLLAACAGGGSKPPASPEPGAAAPRPVLESVRPGRPDDRAAAARLAWLERQAAARRGQPTPSAPAPVAADPANATQKGTPGKLLIFSSVTGHVPVGDVQRSTAGTPEQRENERVAELERALEAEREREERPQQAGADVSAPPPPVPGDASGVLSAPSAPATPELDLAQLASQTTSLPAGSWANAQDLPVVKRSLDADGNGRPEEVRYYDVQTNELLRREEDRDLDGNPDAWSRYEGGELVERVIDTNADGRPDEWEFYSKGRMTLREVDSDQDGNKDVSYVYRNDSLAEVRRDTDADGAVDRVEIFEHRQRVQVIEDTNRDQRMDTWTSYRVVGGQEVVVRIERDPNGPRQADRVRDLPRRARQARAREARGGRRRRRRDRRDTGVPTRRQPGARSRLPSLTGGTPAIPDHGRAVDPWLLGGNAASTAFRKPSRSKACSGSLWPSRTTTRSCDGSTTTYCPS